MPVLAATSTLGGATVTAVNATANATTPAAHAAGPAVNQAVLMINMNVLLLCIFGLFVLFLLPRAAIRFTHKREWTDGHFLRCTEVNAPSVSARPSGRGAVTITPMNRAHIPGNPSYDFEDKWGSSTDASHTYVSHADLLRKGSTASKRERSMQAVPTHMSGWSTMLPTLAGFLRTPLHRGMTVGKAAVALTYFGVVLYFALYKSNPMSNPIRAGFVAVSQIPIVVALGTKNNIIGALIGFGYERLNYLHRFAGRLCVLAANVHAVGYFYKWSIKGTFKESIAEPDMQSALVALIGMDLLFLLSTDYVRTNFYNSIFIPSHIGSVIMLLVAVCYHVPYALPYVLAATGIYSLDRLLRLVKTRVAVARLRPLPDLGVTRVEIPSVNAGWRAGQHVRLRVLSTGMGWRAWGESHPFTIASVSRSHSGEGMVLMCKKAGDWTNKLYDLAQRADYGEANGIGSHVRVAVEGPYGGPGHAIFASFSGALFVAGGSGITFTLGAVQDLMKKDLECKSRVRTIELVWTVQDPSALQPMIPLFSSMLAQAQDTYASLRISVFYTRASSPDALKAFRLPPGLTLSPSRPRIPAILQGVVDRSVTLFSGHKERQLSEGELSGVIVGVCGPSGLGNEVRKAVTSFPSHRRKAVGGLELHEEAFGW